MADVNQAYSTELLIKGNVPTGQLSDPRIFKSVNNIESDRVVLNIIPYHNYTIVTRPCQNKTKNKKNPVQENEINQRDN